MDQAAGSVELSKEQSRAHRVWQAILDNEPEQLRNHLADLGKSMDGLVNSQGRTPLMWACHLGRDECIQVPNWPEKTYRPPQGKYWQDNDGLTAAMWCVLGRRPTSLWHLTKLRRSGLDEEFCSVRDKRGRTILDIALELDDADCVSIIWETTIELCALELPLDAPYSKVAANFKSKFGVDESLARGVAMKAGRVNFARKLALVFDDLDEIARVLIALGPKATAEDGTTAMHIAAWAGFVDVLEDLHRRGGDAGVLDSKGSPPLFSALNGGPRGGGAGWTYNRLARRGSRKREVLEAIKWLAPKFDPMWIDKTGDSALAVALRENIGREAVEYLLPLSNPYGPYGNRNDLDVRSAFGNSLSVELQELVDQAMAKKISIDYSGRDQQAERFRKAAASGDIERLKGMLAAEQKRRAKDGGALFVRPVPLALRPDKDGRTAIFEAASAGHVECVRLLIPISNVLQHDRVGYTPLMAAACARVNAQECFDLLLPFSHASLRSNSGRTAREMLYRHSGARA